MSRGYHRLRVFCWSFRQRSMPMSCQANCPYILAVLTLIVFIDFHPYRPNSLVCSARATQILLNQPCCSWLGKKYYFTIMHESDFVTDKGQRTTVMTLAATAQSQCPRASSHQMPQGTDDVAQTDHDNLSRDYLHLCQATQVCSSMGRSPLHTRPSFTLEPDFF